MCDFDLSKSGSNFTSVFFRQNCTSLPNQTLKITNSSGTPSCWQTLCQFQKNIALSKKINILLFRAVTLPQELPLSA